MSSILFSNSNYQFSRSGILYSGGGSLLVNNGDRVLYTLGYSSGDLLTWKQHGTYVITAATVTFGNLSYYMALPLTFDICFDSDRTQPGYATVSPFNAATLLTGPYVSYNTIGFNVPFDVKDTLQAAMNWWGSGQDHVNLFLPIGSTGVMQTCSLEVTFTNTPDYNLQPDGTLSRPHLLYAS